MVDRANDEQLCAPAIIFVGNSIGLARSSTWFEEKPLLGRRFALTRADGQQSKMRTALENLGAETLDLPLIKIQPSEDRKLIAEVLAGIATYEWVVFTSSNGARVYETILSGLFGYPKFGPMRIACVGQSTAEIFQSYQLDVEIIAEDSTAEGLAKELVTRTAWTVPMSWLSLAIGTVISWSIFSKEWAGQL